MRYLLLTVALGLGPVPSPALPQWVPGLDLIIPVAADPGGDRVNLLGYDRDTQIATYLWVDARCYTTWSPVLTPNTGAVTALIQLTPTLFGFYHDSGAIDLVPRPAFYACLPATP